MKLRVLLMAIPVVLFSGCNEETEPDAWGQFEATEVSVSAEAGGRLVEFRVEEGLQIPAGQIVGRIDVTEIELRREELVKRRESAVARASEVPAQIRVLRAELETAEEEYDRLRRLHADRAATEQQLNRQQGEVQVLRERIEATGVQVRSAQSEIDAIDAQLATIDESIDDASIENPIGGTVLTTYVEPGELVAPNQRLYDIANLESLILRAYVSGAQLSAVSVGDTVTVYADSGEKTRHAFQGTVTWISSDAEFTPTPIQTKEERVELVYAIKVRVPNPDQFLKIGMPGEVELGEPPVQTDPERG